MYVDSGKHIALTVSCPKNGDVPKFPLTFDLAALVPSAGEILI